MIMSTNYKRINTAVCLGDLKQAAIYFEKVIPINSMELMSYSDRPITENYSVHDYMSSRDNLLQDSLNENMDMVIELMLGGDVESVSVTNKKRIIDDLVLTTKMLQHKIVNKLPQLFYNPAYVMGERHEIQQRLIARDIVDNNVSVFDYTPEEIINKFCDTIKVKDFSLTLPSGIGSAKDNEKTNDIQISLININLIDTTKTTWEQILELRKDPKLSSSLRNLKLMMNDNYSGKSLDYIYDDMQRRIEEYELACKSMGLKTISSHISHIKNFATEHGVSLSLITGILSSQGFDLSNGLSLGAIGAAAVSLLQYGIEIKSNNNELSKLKNENPIAYIIEANKKLN